MKKRRTTRVLMKNQRQKAMYILFKIVKNTELGERDELDLAKYQAIVEQYNNKCLGNQSKTEPTVFRRNQYHNEVEKQNKRKEVCKGLDTNHPLKLWSSNGQPTRNKSWRWSTSISWTVKRNRGMHSLL